MSKKTHELITDESFQRWLSGTASSAEVNHWEQWAHQSSGNRKIYDDALELWNSGKFQAALKQDVDIEWEHLQNRFNLSQKHQKTYSFFNMESGHKWRFNNKRLYWIGGFTVAAILLVIVLQFNPFKMFPGSSNHQIVTTEYGHRKALSLPDGTKIILNANSTLKYPAKWNKNTKRILQLQGEAYFNVIKKPAGSQNEFVVLTKDGRIKVVGTQFVVHERGKGTRVVVEEGRVEISPQQDNLKEPDEVSKVVLNSDQLLQFRKNTIKSGNPQNVNVMPYISWWQKQFILDKTQFSEIVQRIEDTYGLSVIINDDQLLNKTLSGSIENQNLDTIINALANALLISVVKQGNTIIFEKAEI